MLSAAHLKEGREQPSVANSLILIVFDGGRRRRDVRRCH